jgi:hypothetical protein
MAIPIKEYAAGLQNIPFRNFGGTPAAQSFASLIYLKPSAPGRIPCSGIPSKRSQAAKNKMMSKKMKRTVCLR